MQGFVDGFNSVVDTLNTYDTYDAEREQRGLLLGDSTVGLIRNSIFRLANSRSTGLTGQFTNLAQVGITVGSGARLTLDQTKFRDALEADRDAVEALEEAGLFDIQLHDDGKARVAILKKPEGMTDEMMEHLAGLEELQILHLNKAPITDVGLEHLAGLSKLDQLILTGTGITDAGLVHLKGLTKLKELHLGFTGVSDEGAERLQKALPEVKIVR